MVKLKTFSGTPSQVEEDFKRWAEVVKPLDVEISACTRFESQLTLCVIYN